MSDKNEILKSTLVVKQRIMILLSATCLCRCFRLVGCMNSPNPITHFPSRLFTPCHRYHLQCPPKGLSSRLPRSAPFSCFKPRPRTPRRNKLRKLTSSPTFTPPPSPSDYSKLQTVVDLDQLSTQAASFFQPLCDSFELRFRPFIASGSDAFQDLRTLVDFDGQNRRIVFSCRPSTVHFLGQLVALSLLVAFAFRVLVSLGFRFRRRLKSGFTNVVRRDRSLGGREVVVARSAREAENFAKKKKTTDFFSVLSSPLSLDQGNLISVPSKFSMEKFRVEEKLPKWWTLPVSNRLLNVNREEYQREANRLVRAIIDDRMRGQDILEDDIIQLRQICVASGVQVSFNTTNMRDSFYRAAVDFVLNLCSRTSSYSTVVEIDGEDIKQFIAGIAENVGLKSFRAARIVSAAVAARTRSCLLQAWALEMQGKRSEAYAELSKICVMLRIFPPEESSPEMEMVALGMKKHLKIGERECLGNMLVDVCGEEIRSCAIDALDLVHNAKEIGDPL